MLYSEHVKLKLDCVRVMADVRLSCMACSHARKRRPVDHPRVPSSATPMPYDLLVAHAAKAHRTYCTLMQPLTPPVNNGRSRDVIEMMQTVSFRLCTLHRWPPTSKLPRIASVPVRACARVCVCVYFFLWGWGVSSANLAYPPLKTP